MEAITVIIYYKMEMFSFFNSKKQHVLDPNKTYLRVQYMTQQQKIEKDLAISALREEYGKDEDVLIPYQDSFQVGLSLIINLQGMNFGSPSITLQEVIAHLEVLKNQPLNSFCDSEVGEISLYLKNNKSLGPKDIILLHDEGEISLYEPQHVLQVIYIKKPLWERIKKKTQKTIKELPMILARLMLRIGKMLLGMLGLNASLPSLALKMVPGKLLLQWATNILAVFFPALGPFLGLGKMMIG